MLLIDETLANKQLYIIKRMCLQTPYSNMIYLVHYILN